MFELIVGGLGALNQVCAGREKPTHTTRIPISRPHEARKHRAKFVSSVGAAFLCPAADVCQWSIDKGRESPAAPASV